ncbi:unnamed protein product, partial [Discosporangium mesarthrocarpum]
DHQLLAAEAPTDMSEDLVSPETRVSTEGVLRTRLVVAPLSIPIGPSTGSPILLNVRAYEGTVPGPTFRIKPGDQLRTMQGRIVGWPNVTNIHVHGLHVSPSGDADNIYRRAAPGETLEYVYHLPINHYPGTFYYHPHYEGSDSVQVLGGMGGAIIVEDPPDTTPMELSSMRDLVILFQEINLVSGLLRNYAAVSRVSGSRMPLFTSGGGEPSSADSKFHFIAVFDPTLSAPSFTQVNGKFQPVVHLSPGEAVRLRLIHAGVNDHLNITLKGGVGGNTNKTAGGCTMLTLARDGVYLSSPRDQPQGFIMGPGSRADVGVQCSEAGMFHLVSSASKAGKGMVYLGNDTDLFEGTLVFLEVSGQAVDMKLPTELPTPLGKARLLQDLRNIPEDEVSRYIFEFNQDGKVYPSGPTAYTWYGINGHQYDPDYIMRTVPLNSVEEWVIVNQRLGRGCPSPGPAPPLEDAQTTAEEGGVGGRPGSDTHGRRRLRHDSGSTECGGGGSDNGETTFTGHPFHLHVNHFQLVRSSWEEGGPDWQVGDWRDTISIPSPGNVTIRWKAYDFTGKAVAHCHIFGHSDTGMMMNFEITP